MLPPKTRAICGRRQPYFATARHTVSVMPILRTPPYNAVYARRAALLDYVLRARYAPARLIDFTPAAALPRL